MRLTYSYRIELHDLDDFYLTHHIRTHLKTYCSGIRILAYETSSMIYTMTLSLRASLSDYFPYPL